MNYLPVDGHPNLVRDVSTGAIISKTFSLSFKLAVILTSIEVPGLLIVTSLETYFAKEELFLEVVQNLYTLLRKENLLLVLMQII